MDIDLVVIDGPNFFNTVGSYLARASFPLDNLKNYLLEWFDFDRFIGASYLGSSVPHLGFVIFHSRRALGRDTYRLKQEETEFFWTRQAANPHFSCITVDISGDQTESYNTLCDSCGKTAESSVTSEKGIDTAITTYLFETAAEWKSLCLVSKDADFVPPVLALRRRGKRVFLLTDDVAQTPALVNACQSCIDFDYDFFQTEVDFYNFLLPGGGLDVFVDTILAASGLTLTIELSNYAFGSGHGEPEPALTVGIFHKEEKDRIQALEEETKSILFSPKEHGAGWRWSYDSFDITRVIFTSSTHLSTGLARYHRTYFEGARWKEHVGNIWEEHRRLRGY